MRARRKANKGPQAKSPGRHGKSPQREESDHGEASAPAADWPWGLHVLVFTAGAVLMGLEIAGSRVLAPHFGNSVFVWGSLISVFLTALSVGYYLGGRIADRYPSRLLLHSICAVVALSMFAIAFMSNSVLEWLVDRGFGEQSGPLAASILLFLAPSVGMGIVSPFAIRLGTHSVSSVGRSAGTLYALSTLGSIAGTLLTTFVCIPQFGLMAILKGLAAILLMSAVLTVPFWKRAGTLAGTGGLSIVAGVCLLLPVTRSSLQPHDRLLVDTDTPYHHIMVIDNRGLRQLRFDQFVETAVLTKPPYPSVAGYTDYFHLAFLAKPDIERTAFIGAGGGVGPRTFSRHAPEMEIDVVDIDPKVLEIARTHFFLDDTPQIHAIAKDGRMFLRKSQAQYDCVVLDAFTIGGRIPFHLVTKEFFSLCRDRMTDSGVFVMNINSAIDGPTSRIFGSTYQTLNAVFEHTYVFAMDHRLRGTSESMNVILVATNAPEPLTSEAWAERAERYWSQSYVDGPRLKRAVADLLVDLPDLSRVPLFTDDYAPIETMAF